MSADIIAVEYSPRKSEQNVWSWLEGCLGEANKENIERVIGRSKWGEEKGVPEKQRKLEILVRFPLALPYANLCYYPGKPLHNSTERRLAASGILLPLSDIYPVRDKPISTYEGKPIDVSNLNDLRALTNKDYYYYTHSLTKLRYSLIPFLRKNYGYTYVWRRESSADAPGTVRVFLQARLYGAATLIRSHSDSFRGFALVIYSRKVDSKMSSHYAFEDVYIFSNTDEYVDYLDGERLNRPAGTEYIDTDLMGKRINLITPKEFNEERDKWLNGPKKVLKEDEIAKKHFKYQRLVMDNSTTTSTTNIFDAAIFNTK